MDMKTKGKGVKKFTQEEKLSILREAKQKGVKVTLAKYGLYPATFYYWKKHLAIYGESGLLHQKAKDKDKRIQQLEEENMRLKVLLAEKELQNSVQELHIKKNTAIWKNRI